MKIIKQAHTECYEEQNLEYEYINHPGAGFSFPVENGKPVMRCALAEENYKWCQEHPDKVRCKGIVTRRSSCRVEALIQCECGEEFYLGGWYYGCTQCPGCGRWYSEGGYEVEPPEKWEEELEEDM